MKSIATYGIRGPMTRKCPNYSDQWSGNRAEMGHIWNWGLTKLLTERLEKSVNRLCDNHIDSAYLQYVKIWKGAFKTQLYY